MIMIEKWSSQRLRVRIPYDPDCIVRIRQVQGRCWHPDLKQWTIPYTEAGIKRLMELFEGEHMVISAELQQENALLMTLHSRSGEKKTRFITDHESIKRMINNMRRRGYSYRTQKAYPRTCQSI